MKKINIISVSLIISLILVLPACWWGNSNHSSCCGCDHEVAATHQFVTQAVPGVVVINVLDKDHYDDCHIKGSMHVPFEHVDSFIVELETLYNSNKSAIEIIVYCSNYMCSASGEVAKKLIHKGFNARAYEAGMAEWFEQGLPVEGACIKPYLKRKVMASEHSDVPVITTQELAVKLAIKEQSPSVHDTKKTEGIVDQQPALDEIIK